MRQSLLVIFFCACYSSIAHAAYGRSTSSSGSSGNAAGKDYELFSTRLARRNRGKFSGPSPQSILQSIALGVFAYLGNRFAHFIDMKFISKLKPEEALSSSLKAINATMVEEMSRDQEELWRVVHNIYEGQTVAAAAKEGSESGSIFGESAEQRLQEIDGVITDFIDKMTRRIESLEASQASKAEDMERALAMLRASLTQLSSDVERNEAALTKVRESIPKLLASHDSKVIERLKAFSGEVKDILRSSMANSSNSGAGKKK